MKKLSKTSNPINFWVWLDMMYKEIDELKTLKNQYNNYNQYEYIERNKNKSISNFIERYFEKTKNRMLNLKTNQGKNNCIEDFYINLNLEISQKYMDKNIRETVEKYYELLKAIK